MSVLVCWLSPKIESIFYAAKAGKVTLKTNYGIKLQERNGWFSFCYTVPKGKELRFKGKKQVRIALGTKDREEALEKRIVLAKQYDAIAWAEGGSDLSLDAAKLAADNLNVPLTPASTIQTTPIAERTEILDAIFKVVKSIAPTATEDAVLVGAIDPPTLTMRQAFERFKELSPEKVKGKDETQTKIFWGRYELATDEFIAAMGNIDVLKITDADVKKYRRIVKARLDNNEFKSDTANKRLDWIRIILNTVFYEDYDNRRNPFQGLKKLNGYDDDAKRPPFTPAEIVLVRESAKTSGISDEVKAIIRIGEATGANARELALMEAGDIHLTANVPFIQIRPNSLRSKVKKGGERHRDIPLVGDALEAMREFPEGFKIFQNPTGPTNANQALSAFFRKVTPGKGFSSYRHTMKDWLRNSGCNDTLQNSIIGHATKGLGKSMWYGKGYELDVKAEAIETALAYGERKIAEEKHQQNQSDNNNQPDMTDATAD